MAIAPLNTQTPAAQTPVTEPTCFSSLTEKVKDFVLSRWTFVIASAILSGALFGAAVASSVALIGGVVAYLTGKMEAPAPEINAQNYRAHNIQVFQETLRSIQEGQRISLPQHQEMLEGVTVCEFVPAVQLQQPRVQTQFIIEPVTSFEMLRRISQMGHRPFVLDMANLYTRGGGVLHGSNAQEETLCRQSDLYKGLEQVQYPIPERGGIFVPSVQFFRDDQYNFVQPITADVFVSAAYNCNEAHGRGYDKPENLMVYIDGTIAKIRSQLRVAIVHGSRALVLSAFGCGAFRNEPQVIARTYREILQEPEFQGAFDVVAFAIYDPPWATDKNYPVFQAEFQD